MAISIFSRCALALCMFLPLAACGGGGDDEQPGKTEAAANDPKPMRLCAAPEIRHLFPTTGSYTMTLTGTYTVTKLNEPDNLSVFFSFSGQGTHVSGDSYPVYPISAVGQVVAINQTVTINMTGVGPWQMDIVCYTLGSVVNGQNLNLAVTKN